MAAHSLARYSRQEPGIPKGCFPPAPSSSCNWRQPSPSFFCSYAPLVSVLPLSGRKGSGSKGSGSEVARFAGLSFSVSDQLLYPVVLSERVPVQPPGPISAPSPGRKLECKKRHKRKVLRPESYPFPRCKHRDFTLLRGGNVAERQLKSALFAYI